MTFSTTPQFWITACIALICIIALLRLLLLFRENRLLSEQLTKTTVSLDRACRERDRLQNEQQREPAFAKNLHEAGITTELQQPRLNAQSALSKATIPEKYSFIASMTQKGMNGEEIASLLSISREEAEQLVSLSRIAHEQFQHDET